MIAPWMDIAFSELNKFIREVPTTTKNNPDIMRYLSYVMDINTYSDETPWCAAFINYCLYKVGIKGTGKPNARSYLDWGTRGNNFGAIVVLWRDDPNGALGHVGFKIAQDRKNIYLLGGNQSNAVTIQKYPIERILDMRYKIGGGHVIRSVKD